MLFCSLVLGTITQQPVIYVTLGCWKKGYKEYRLSMGLLSKAVVLSLLLIIAGVPGITPHLCAQPLTSSSHDCCAAHSHAASCKTASTLSVNPSCCRVAPIESMPAKDLSLSDPSATACGLPPTSQIAGILPAPVLISDHGFSRSAKVLHSPVHALLCSFLI